jgi:hypothetical protein
MTTSSASRISRNWTQSNKAISRARITGMAVNCRQEKHEHKKEMDASSSAMNGEWKY